MKSDSEKDWYADESLWKAWYPYIFDEKKFEMAEEQTKRLLKLVKSRGRGKKVLDLCCGPGRFSIPLAQCGHQVTGVDLSRYYLNKARARARKAKVRVSFVNQDMRSFVRPHTYHLAINMWSSFGYFEDREDDFKVLQNLHASLKRNGCLVIDNMGKELIGRWNHHTFGEDLPDGTTFIDHGRIVDDWTRIEREWYLINGDKFKRFDFSLNLYSGQEMRDLMEKAGFVDVKLYGDLDGNEYGQRASRLIAVGRKK